MPKSLNGQVVVVVGGSSGIGRATARELATRHATVVVAARGEEALAATVEEIEAAGGTALAVPMDTGAWPDVQRLVQVTQERFGRIDAWVHAAAVSGYGELADLPLPEIERILQVDLLGQIYGVKAVLPVMRQQGSGTIVGISSILGVRAVPLQVPYCIAKHGVMALFEGLRLEERRARSGVNLTVVLPASIDTPFYDHAPSWVGTRPAPIPPVYRPESVARAIVAALERPRRHVVVGGAGGALWALQRLSPAAVDRLLMVGQAVFRLQHGRRPDAGQGNLHDPAPGPGAVHGSSSRLGLRHSAFGAVSLRPNIVRTLTGAAAAVALGRSLARRRHAQPGVADAT